MEPNETQLGIYIGWDEAPGRHVLPECPHPIWVGKGLSKRRCPERDQWLEGWGIGRALRKRHAAELAAAIAAAKT